MGDFILLVVVAAALATPGAIYLNALVNTNRSKRFPTAGTSKNCHGGHNAAK
jgi:hypothetical protein